MWPMRNHTTYTQGKEKEKKNGTQTVKEAIVKGWKGVLWKEMGTILEILEALLILRRKHRPFIFLFLGQEKSQI